ncbi:glycosyl hydrolase family 18 protein [Chitinophaga vietnamensis]|uniref:glycosyl hydrolase family 18 protein n=1 Tax=Chitinophaga vietnamensis TaxID=2593957 RepID=UPI001177DBD6|nr:glycosyl hydrolase family 18 protein [Chitinophaga vietnamensis]
MKPVFTLKHGLSCRIMMVSWLLCLWLYNNVQAQVSPTVPATTKQHNKQVIGYITQWDAWKNVSGIVPAGGYNQLNVDYSQYTILNFSFFGVAVDGSLHSGDYRNKNIYQVGAVQQPAALVDSDIYSSWDMYLLYGELDILYYVPDNSYAYTLGYRNSGSGWSNVNTGQSGAFPLSVPKQGGAPGVIDLAHQKGVKVLASIGGWSMCKHYPEMAADTAKRARFLAGCRQLMSMGFDGIDLDWEYPNDPGMNIEHYSAADYTNFAALVEAIRATIGPGKLITSCFSAAPGKLPGFDWPRLNKTIDFFNMMTYDYNGGWSNKAGHNAPLYDYPGAEYSNFSLDATARAVRALGVNMSKVNLGAPFYGRGVITTGAAALNAPTTKRAETVQPDGPIQTCADYTNWAKDLWDGTPNYSYILQQTGSGSGWTDNWDDVAKVPYKTKGNFFLSYDNEKSIAAKAQYIKDNGLGGVIIWQVFGDMLNMTASTQAKGKLIYCPNTTSPLVNKINEVFAGGSGTPANQPPVVSITAPANNAVFTAPAAINITAAASDTDGVVKTVKFYSGGTLLATDSTAPYTYSWNNVPAGTYSLTAVATDDKGASTTSAAVNITVNTSTPVVIDSGKVIVGYWQNWGATTDASPYIPLRNVNPKYNVIQIAFAISGTDKATMSFVPENTTAAQFAADVQYLQSQGRKVLLSIGGQNGTLDLSTAAQKTAFVSSMEALLDQYNFDGFDLDIEGGTNLQLNSGDNDFTNPTTPKVVNLVAAVKEIIAYRAGKGKKCWLTMAPETYYVQTAYGAAYSPLVGAYLPVIYGLRNELTFIHPQYYNTGSVMALDNGVYNQATSDFIVSMSEMLLQGFPVSGTGKTFPALRQDQVAFGIPASASAAGGGYTTPVNVKKALDYLMKGITYGGAYTLRKPSGYSGFRGIMTWSVNWDKANGDEFANNYYDYFFGSTPVNKPPVVSITAPANNATFAAPANINITANASDSDGVVKSVKFYNGSTLLATDSTAPYTYSWNNVPAGTYSLTAVATDDKGASTTSAVVTVKVNAPGNKPPVVSITSPANNASFTAPATINITAAASDSDGVITSVQFYNGSALLGTSTAAPYTFSWTNVPAGTYSITAKATDNGNASTTSAPVSVTVTGGSGGCNGLPVWSASTAYVGGDQVVYNGKIYKAKWWTQGNQPDQNTGSGLPWEYVSDCSGTPGNQPPVVNITAPANNATFTAPATVNITATATDSDGTIKWVQFYNGSTLLATDSAAPYAFSWTNVPAGTYSITAKATDNGNATTTSAAVSITVGTGGGSSCSGLPAWSATTAYVGGAQVVYNSKVYKAKWWTQGDQPDINTGDGKPWQYVQDCTGATSSMAAASKAPAFSVVAYPNPVAGNDLQLQWQATSGEKLLIEVLGVSGHAPVLQQVFIPSGKGRQQVKLDMRSVPAGTWIIRVTGQQSGISGSAKVMRIQ